MDRTNSSLNQVEACTEKAAKLVSEIAVSTGEQSRVLGRIKSEVTEIDAVIQRNAATAEETASTAEEMNAQAELMNAMVNELVKVVGGDHSAAKGPQPRNPQNTMDLYGEAFPKPSTENGTERKGFDPAVSMPDGE